MRDAYESGPAVVVLWARKDLRSDTPRAEDAGPLSLLARDAKARVVCRTTGKNANIDTGIERLEVAVARAQTTKRQTAQTKRSTAAKKTAGTRARTSASQASRPKSSAKRTTTQGSRAKAT